MKKLAFSIIAFVLFMLGLAWSQPTLVPGLRVQSGGLLQTPDIQIGPEITPPALNPVEHCYTPAGWATSAHWHLIGNASSTTITGFGAIADERWRLLMNLGTTDITIPNQADPTAACSVVTPSALPITIPSGGGLLMHYETSNLRWLVFSQAGPPISTNSGPSSPANNIWIGGGGTVFAGPGTLATGRNTSLGIGSLNACTTCDSNTAVGFNALAVASTAETETAIGYNVLGSCTTGVDNTCGGYEACQNLTSGTENTVWGVESLTTCTTCTQNTALGMSAGQSLSTGTQNTCVGKSSGCGTTGTQNIALGYLAGTGLAAGIVNIAIGPSTMIGPLTGAASGNIGIGGTSLTALTSGTNNTCLGLFTCTGTTTTSENVALGDHALASGNGNNNTAIGAQALQAAAGGFSNVALGFNAAANVTSGAANTCIGQNTCGGLTTGNFNTVVGASIGSLAAGLSNNVIIGDSQGNIRYRVNSSANHLFDPGVATTQTMMIGTAMSSASHGTLSTDASNFAGRVTSVGANTSTTLTFGGGGFASVAHCYTQVASSGAGIGEIIVMTPSKTAPVFSCFDSTTAAAANCPDFDYNCWGN